MSIPSDLLPGAETVLLRPAWAKLPTPPGMWPPTGQRFLFLPANGKWQERICLQALLLAAVRHGARVRPYVAGTTYARSVAWAKLFIFLGLVFFLCHMGTTRGMGVRKEEAGGCKEHLSQKKQHIKNTREWSLLLFPLLLQLLGYLAWDLSQGTE